MTFSINPLQQQIQQNAFAQDDESDTDTEQRLRQKNLGSGESTNFNCAENLITSASDSIECIPSGPAPPTPAIPFTIVGSLGGAITTCENQNLPSRMSIDATGGESGTVTGTVTLDEAIVVFTLPITGETTDGNTFSLSGEDGRCNVGAFTVSGNCETDVTVSYEEEDATGTFTGDVECTLGLIVGVKESQNVKTDIIL
jgi:hypothetical protein